MRLYAMRERGFSLVQGSQQLELFHSRQFEVPEMRRDAVFDENLNLRVPVQEREPFSLSVMVKDTINL